VASHLDLLDAQRSLFAIEQALAQGNWPSAATRCSCTRRWAAAGASRRRQIERRQVRPIIENRRARAAAAAAPPQNIHEQAPRTP
jgi:hypothetical protein